jgi:serine protease
VQTSPILEDPDYDILRYRYRWSVNGTVVRDVTTAALSDALRKGMTNAGNSVTCTVTPSDGVLSGAAASSSATISASSTGNVLQNGIPVSGISGATGSQKFWTMSVPAGASNLQFQSSGGTGDADMYVRFGSAPTTTTYDCRPYEDGNDETCSFPTPAAGTWHVMLDGYAAYSGLTLVGSYQTSPTCNAISDVEPNNSMTAPQAISGSCNQISGTFLNDASTQQHDYFRLSLPAGRTVTALLNGLTADYDLEIYTEGGDYVAYSYACCANPDQASWTNTTASAMNVYILVYRSSSTRTTYQLRVSY